MKRNYTSIVVCILILSVFISGCKTNNETTAQGDQNLEKYAGYTASYLYEAIGYIYFFSSTILYSEILSILLTYNNSTGYWSINKTTPLGYTIDVRIQFKDGAGNVQKYYNLTTTNTITTEGTITGPEGSVTFNITMTGLTPNSNIYTTNGNGTSSYLGYNGSFEINNLQMSKQEDVYPESGTIIVTSGGQTVTITFNGTDTATGTYSVAGATITFRVNLTTGAISY